MVFFIRARRIRLLVAAWSAVLAVACSTRQDVEGVNDVPPGEMGAAGSTDPVQAPNDMAPALLAGNSAPQLPATMEMPHAGAGVDEPGAAPVDGCPTFDSSFAAIQKVIFEGHGCVARLCAQGGHRARAVHPFCV